ncbi:MAG: DUF624 domain-containing protein [Clostridia bacterium]|nr:DUF624 domain-containing protein [Clostridia bacterium]
MAGFFGLFNYDKEGPGISKDAPKKKTIVVFFEMFFRNFWKFITINFIYSLISIPVFTNGMASVGITNVARNTARDKHSFGISDFFETIRKNLKQSIIAGIINAIVFGFLIFDIYFFFSIKGKFGIVGTGITLALLVTFIMMGYYLWTLIITFDYTLKQAYSNSFKFVFLNFKYSFLCLFVNILILALNIALIYLFAKYWLFVLFIELVCFVCVYPAFNALLIQFCTFPSIKKFIIDPYYAEHPDEDIEKRKRLGLEIEENKPAENNTSQEDEEDDGVIFND